MSFGSIVSHIGLTFEVIEGGFLDIDVRVLGPEQEEIITRERESNGKITFAAAKTGAYHYCFSNKMSTMTPKGPNCRYSCIFSVLP